MNVRATLQVLGVIAFLVAVIVGFFWTVSSGSTNCGTPWIYLTSRINGENDGYYRCAVAHAEAADWPRLPFAISMGLISASFLFRKGMVLTGKITAK